MKTKTLLHDSRIGRICLLALLFTAWLPSARAYVYETFLSPDTLFYYYVTAEDSFDLTVKGKNTVDIYPYYGTGSSDSYETLVIPDTVNYNGVCYKVTGIDTHSRYTYGAFYGHYEITSVTFGKYVTSIGYRAFANCTGLTEVTIPASISLMSSYAFSNCSSLASITLENGTELTGLPYNCFAGTAITEFTIPEGIESLSSPFTNCNSLATINVPTTLPLEQFDFNNLPALENINVAEGHPKVVSYDGSVYSKDGTILQYVPRGKSSFTFRSGVTTVGYQALANMTNLTTVDIPSSVTTISSYAFENSTGFQSLDIPSSVTTIGDFAFNGCSALESVVIPDAIDTLASGIFYDCSSLQNVTLPAMLRSIGASAFRGCSSLEAIELPWSLVSIGTYAFHDCYSLSTISFPDSLRAIQDGAFGECSALQNVTLPEHLTTLGAGAFAYCSSFTSITIPNSITKFGIPAAYWTDWSPFAYCTNLAEIIFHDDSPLTDLPPQFYKGTAVKTVVVPSQVVYIGEEAFGDDITEVTIPAKTTVLGYSYESLEMGGLVVDYESHPVSINGDSLQSITISDDNTVFSSADGVLFDKDKTKLLLYPKAKADSAYTVPSTVTTVGERSISLNNSIQSITFSEGVTNIEYSAANSCSSLASVTFPSTLDSIGSSAFYYDKKLTAVSFPGGLKYIGSGCFSDCTKLATVEENGSDPFIGSDAFRNTAWFGNQDGIVYFGTTCLGYYTYFTDSISLTIKEGTTKIADLAFGDNNTNEYVYEMKLPSSLTYIGEAALAKTELKSLTIPDNVTYIGSQALLGTKYNAKIYIGKSVQTLGSIEAQQFATYLDSVTISPDNPYLVKNDYLLYNKQTGTIFVLDLRKKSGDLSFPEEITEIPASSLTSAYWYSDTYITSLSLLKNQKLTVPSAAFYDWETGIYEDADYMNYNIITEQLKHITAINVEDGNPYYASYNGDLYSSDLKTLYLHPAASPVKKLTMPDGATAVNYYAVKYAAHLDSIILAPTVETIQAYAVYYCDSLTYMDLGKSLTTAEEQAITGCWLLRKLTLPTTFNIMVLLDEKYGLAQVDTLNFNTIGNISLDCDGLHTTALTVSYPCVCTVTVTNFDGRVHLIPVVGIYHDGEFEPLADYDPQEMLDNYLYFTTTETDGIVVNYVVVDKDAVIDGSTASDEYDDENGSKARTLRFNIREIAHAATQDGVRAHAKKLVVSDGSVFSTPIPIETEETSMDVVVDNSWQTIALPFNGTIPAGTEVAELNAAGELTAGGTSVKFSSVTGGMVAGKAYLIRSTGGDIDGITAANEVVEAQVEADSTAQFIANLGETITFNEDFTSLEENVGYTFYGLDDETHEFRQMTAADQCPTYRCYLKVLSVIAPGSDDEIITAEVDGESIATGIHGTNADGSRNNATIYNLSGQKLHLQQKGMNIVNGQKVIVK